jgi:hypothetical protein
VTKIQIDVYFVGVFEQEDATPLANLGFFLS